MYSFSARINIISYVQSQAHFTLIYMSLCHMVFNFLQKYFKLRQQEILIGTFTNIDCHFGYVLSVSLTRSISPCATSSPFQT